MYWKGEKLETVQDLMDKGINQCFSKAEAQTFMQIYRQYNPHADANIGYISGYYDEEKRRRVQDWFGTEHPIFGRG